MQRRRIDYHGASLSGSTGPVFDGQSRGSVCAAVAQDASNPERRNGQSRHRYALRRARGLCTACGAPAQGAARCPPCAERGYHDLAHLRGIPVWKSGWRFLIWPRLFDPTPAHLWQLLDHLEGLDETEAASIPVGRENLHRVRSRRQLGRQIRAPQVV